MSSLLGIPAEPQRPPPAPAANADCLRVSNTLELSGSVKAVLRQPPLSRTSSADTSSSSVIIQRVAPLPRSHLGHTQGSTTSISLGLDGRGLAGRSGLVLERGGGSSMSSTQMRAVDPVVSHSAAGSSCSASSMPADRPASSTPSLAVRTDPEGLAVDQSSQSSADDVFKAPSSKVTKSDRANTNSPRAVSAHRSGARAMSLDGHGVRVRSHTNSLRAGTLSQLVTESSLGSVERRLPRVNPNRKVGALGISVSTLSEDESGKTRERDWSAGDRESTDPETESVEHETKSVNPVGVQESHFRGIVDDLTVESELRPLTCELSRN